MLEGARGAITDDAKAILVGVASAWEIAIKHHIGKLARAAAVTLDATAAAGRGFEELAITVDDGSRGSSPPPIAPRSTACSRPKPWPAT